MSIHFLKELVKRIWQKIKIFSFWQIILSIILKTYSLDKELKLSGEIDVGHFWDLEDKGDTHENFTGVCLIQACFTQKKRKNS